MPVKLKVSYDTPEEIPEGYNELYVERDGRLVLTGIEGVKTQSDIDKINEALRKERSDHKASKDKLAKFGDIDPEVLPAQLAELEDTKAQLAAAIKDGKVDPAKNAEAIDAAVRRALGPVEREKSQLQRDLDNARKLAGDKDVEIGNLQGSIRRGKIEGNLRDAAIAAKVIPTAIDDAVMVGAGAFDLTEDGRILTKDGTGMTPGLDPKEWLKDMQEKRPHWWPASQGGGSGSGGRGGVPNRAENPWSAEGWNVSKQGQYVRAHGEAKALEAAKAAGLASLTATKPAAKVA